MGSRSKFPVQGTDSDIEIKESPVYEPIKKNTDSEIEWIKSDILIRSLIDAVYKITTPGGREYVFHGSGSEVKVLEEDVEYLLSKKVVRGCCGGASERPAFELVF